MHGEYNRPAETFANNNNNNINDINNDNFSVFLKMPNSTTTSIETQRDWTVGRMKQKVRDTHGVGVQQLRLLHGGRELQHDDSPLAVQPNSTIHCLFTLHGGGKAKSKGGKSFKKGKKQEQKSELIYAEEDQEYAQVIRLLGNSRLAVLCADGKERLCTIRGKLVRRAWVNVGSVILISLRQFEDARCDMIHRYSDEEARRLRAYKELPQNMKLASEESIGIDGEVEDSNVVFDFDLDENGELDISDI